MKTLGVQMSKAERDRIFAASVSGTQGDYELALLRAQLEKVMEWLLEHRRWHGATLAKLLGTEIGVQGQDVWRLR